ncbi:hypothetical protein LguiB_021867 [Lonicera macranthoides]
MGKLEHQLPLQQEQIQARRANSSLFCERCSMGLSRICGFKCVVVMILSFAVFFSAIFWVFPYHKRQFGFEAKDSVKQSAQLKLLLLCFDYCSCWNKVLYRPPSSTNGVGVLFLDIIVLVLEATVQAYFNLPKPVSLLVRQIPRLEYDIYGEIGFPYTKVAILSMNESNQSNFTDVVFGILSDPMNVPLNPVTSSVLRSSLIELFLQDSNLTLTNSTFGQPSSFEILKFPGGVTVIPEQSAAIWQIPQILFNFTLNNSIDEIVVKFVELKEQLKLGLRLRPYENVYIQVRNEIGSTKDRPITVEASVTSDLGTMLPQRLKQLAQTITGSPAKNLGLDNSVFGKVKQISLSAYLNHTLDPNSPTPSPAPAPSPVQDDYTEPYISPSESPAPSPYPYGESPGSLPLISNSPAPSIVDSPPLPSRHCGGKISPGPSPKSHADPPSSAFPPSMGPEPQWSSGLSPLPVVSYGSNPDQEKGNRKGSVPPPRASASVLPIASSYKIILYVDCKRVHNTAAPSFDALASRVVVEEAL